jgi:HSP20 family molecular chaperone IbpA
VHRGVRLCATATEAIEEPTKYTVNCELPGLTIKDVDVEIDPEQRVLHISAKREHRASEEEDEGEVKWLVHERHFGKLDRQMKLPDDAVIGENEIDCRMRNGLLTVTLQKVPKEESEEDKAPPRLKVPISSH